MVPGAGRPAGKLFRMPAAPRKGSRPGQLKKLLNVPVYFLSPDSELDKEMERLFYQTPLLSSEIAGPKASAIKPGKARKR